MQREVRTFKPRDLRALPDKGALTGYAIVYDSESLDVGGFTEIIRQGAVDACLTGADDIFATLDHVMNVVNILGRRDNGTLKLWSDDVGVAFEVTLPKTTVATDALENVRAENVTGMSFAFSVSQDKWSVKPDGSKLREVLLFSNLYEISVVVTPAYPQTDVQAALRSLEQWEKSQQPKGPTVDHLLRELDFVLNRRV